MIDITDVGTDIVFYNSQAPKTKNLFNTQVGYLEYAKLFGIDIQYFLQEGLQFQNASFRAYLVEVAAQNGINIAEVITLIQELSESYTFNIQPPENTTALIAR